MVIIKTCENFKWKNTHPPLLVSNPGSTSCFKSGSAVVTGRLGHGGHGWQWIHMRFIRSSTHITQWYLIDTKIKISSPIIMPKLIQTHALGIYFGVTALRFCLGFRRKSPSSSMTSRVFIWLKWVGWKKESMGRTVYLLTYLVDFYGKLVGTYTSFYGSQLVYHDLYALPETNIFARKLMVGINIVSFWGPACFQGRSVCFLGSNHPISIISWRWISQFLIHFSLS